MNRRDYRKIAKQHKVSVAQVKKEMQKSINEAYEKPTLHANCVPRKGDVPTINEFITYTVSRSKIIQCTKEQEEKQL